MKDWKHCLSSSCIEVVKADANKLVLVEIPIFASTIHRDVVAYKVSGRSGLLGESRVG